MVFLVGLGSSVRSSDIGEILALVKVLFPKVVSVSLLGACYGAVVCGRGVCYSVRSGLCPVPPLHRSRVALNKSFLFRGMSSGDLAPLLPWAQGFLLGPRCLWPYPHVGSTRVIWREARSLFWCVWSCDHHFYAGEQLDSGQT